MVPACILLVVGKHLQIVEVVHCVGAGVTGVAVMLSVTGQTVVVTGTRVVLVNVLLAGQFFTFGGHFTTVYVDAESVSS